jgi:hypothetical protein
MQAEGFTHINKIPKRGGRNRRRRTRLHIALSASVRCVGAWMVPGLSAIAHGRLGAQTHRKAKKGR